MLNIKDLKVSIEDKNILNGVNLEVSDGSIMVLMGPNGSGKSTLAQAIMGHPAYEITDGTITFDGKELNELSPDERAELGIFLSFQYPSEILGVIISNYLRMLYNKKIGKNLPPVKFRKILHEKMDILGISHDFGNRYLNEGFSGGEKKRMEMLQMLILEPKLVILDETDSGLDVDSLKIVSEAVTSLHENSNMSVLLITHYTRILKYITPDTVSIIQNGKVVESGGEELAHQLEEQGYAPFGE